jgi:hypothetical protein
MRYRTFRVMCEGSDKYGRPACGQIGDHLGQDDAEMLAHSHGISKGHKCYVESPTSPVSSRP